VTTGISRSDDDFMRKARTGAREEAAAAASDGAAEFAAALRQSWAELASGRAHDADAYLNTGEGIAGHAVSARGTAESGMVGHRRFMFQATTTKTTSRRTPLIIVIACALIWPPVDARLRGGE
jgi:hypothetical protein